MNPTDTDLMIRPMILADIPRVIEITSALEQLPHYSQVIWAGMLDPQSHPRRVALVASPPSGEIHGFALTSLFPPQAELEIIAVPLSSRGRGIATCLLRSLLAHLHQAAIHELWLEVRSSNSPAIDLYRKLGFRVTGRRPRYYADPVEDGLLMDLQIP